MARRLPRRLAIAGLFGIVGFTTACPPPWYFWRHERHEEHHERRHDRGERHDDHRERHDDRGERHERKERH